MNQKSATRKQPVSRILPLALALIVILVLTGACIWRGFGRRVRPVANLPEMNRTNLVHLDGLWRQIGQTSPFTGVLLEYYPDGALESRSVISNGMLNGLSECWFTNGQLRVRETYRTNISDGVRTKWYPDGKIQSEATIVLGQMQGVFRRWHENGKLAEEIPMLDGKIEGVGRSYYESGFLKTELAMRDGTVVKANSWPDGKQSSGGL